MKKIILGTLAAASVIASMGAASAQMQSERGYYGWNMQTTQDGRNIMDPNKNFAPDSIK